MWYACDHQLVTTHWLLDAPLSTQGVFIFSLSKCCCLHFWRKKFGSMSAQGYFKGSKVKNKSESVTFCELAQSTCTYWVAITWCANKYPCLFFFFFFTSFTLSDYCCLHLCRNLFGLMLAQRWLYGSKVNHKSQCATFFLSLNNQYAIYNIRRKTRQIPIVALNSRDASLWCLETDLFKKSSFSGANLF